MMSWKTIFQSHRWTCSHPVPPATLRLRPICLESIRFQFRKRAQFLVLNKTFSLVGLLIVVSSSSSQRTKVLRPQDHQRPTRWNQNVRQSSAYGDGQKNQWVIIRKLRQPKIHKVVLSSQSRIKEVTNPTLLTLTITHASHKASKILINLMTYSGPM